MTKEQAINKINNTPSIYLNDDQKRIARGIINSISKNEDVLNYFDFIMKRADVGFKFDVAPEIALGRIAIVNEMKKLNINISNKVDINENKLIIGDNYEALKNLLLTHKEKIDIIYIDPPYNTNKSKEDGNVSSKEGESSKFIYKDKFGRNG
jgi:adenine-specific DNA methylase